MTRATFKCTAFNRQKNDLSTIFVRYFLHVRSTVNSGGEFEGDGGFGDSSGGEVMWGTGGGAQQCGRTCDQQILKSYQ